ncbi:hypothetical protein [Variovorax sp. JS1663]|uniref:hypothetical protein n=1 Tax=Variovorax sp. JS1663 TaxID=1851577 RepID=UPI001302CB4A|nr:hypothetical protein [Variovorax sp. JS1663]
MTTPKPLKLLQLAGVLLLLLGVIVRAGTGELWGTATALLGAVLFTAGRVLAWWKNG